MIKTHDFQDLMGVSIETEDKWLNKRLNSHICYGKGGSSSNQQQDVPPTLQPYITEILDRASDLYAPDKQYIPYEGERIVGFSPEELAAQEAVKGQVGQGILGDETLGAASTYYDPALGLLGTAGQLGQQAVSEITADEITGRMSPYQQAVTDIAKREAAREADIYDQRLKAQAAGTGGFGGSRQAILEAQAAADLGSRLSDIQTRGSQAAYQDAVRAAEAQRARQAAGAQAAGGLSQLYGGLGQQALGQAYREAGYLSGVGETQRGMQQQRADLAYQEFMRQQQYPTQQLQQFSSLVQGFPFSFGNYGQQVPSPFQQTVGTGLATYGLGRNLGFFSEGGNIKPPVTVEDGEVTRNAVLGGVAASGLSGLSRVLAPLFTKRLVAKRVPQIDRRTGEELPIGEAARRLGITDDVSRIRNVFSPSRTATTVSTPIVAADILEKTIGEDEKENKETESFFSNPSFTRLVTDPVGVAKDYGQAFLDDTLETAALTAGGIGTGLALLTPAGRVGKKITPFVKKSLEKIGVPGQLMLGGAGLYGYDALKDSSSDDFFEAAEAKEEKKRQEEEKKTQEAAADKGSEKAEIPSYLSAYNDSIKLLQQRQKDIAGRREEGKAAIDEAFNLQLISLGTLIATTPKDKLYEKLPKEITKFTKKKDLVELQDKYDKQELTNLLAQASIGESLSKIISEVGGSGLPTNFSSEITRTINALYPYASDEVKKNMFQKALTAGQNLNKKEGNNSGIRTQAILNAISKVDPKKRETVDALGGAKELR